MDIFMNTKKMAALLLAVIMLVSLCACGARTDAPAQTTAATETITETAAAEA